MINHINTHSLLYITIIFDVCFNLPSSVLAFTPNLSAPPSSSSSLARGSILEATPDSSILIDKSTLTLLEHINLNVPNHDYILDFYLDILGMGLDPRRAGSVAKGEGVVWMNCGATQFHLPCEDVAQVVPGSIGLWYEDLTGLKERLSRYDGDSSLEENGKPFESYSIGVDERTKREHVRIVDRYGNIFYCRQSLSPTYDDKELIRTIRQPLLTSTDIVNREEYQSSIPQRFGMNDDLQESECRGISYIEFHVPRNTAARIAEFYDCVFDAPTNVFTVPNDPTSTGTTTIAIVGFGSLNPETGQTSQSLIFRESDCPIPSYDGHHIALYVGENEADYEAAFKRILDAGVVWVNPRFSDKVTTLTSAKKLKQFRFKDILDLKTGKKLFELEHEIRSICHSSWPGDKLLNE